MLKLGLTGGIASGKSTISAYLRQAGLPIFDADQAARDAVAKGSEGLRQVVEAFGAEYLTEAGELDRAKIASLIFADKTQLKKLEAILHKIVLAEAQAFLAQQENQGAKAAVLDVPLLIETGWHEFVDEVWLVSVSKEEQVQRAMKRSGMTREEVEARIKMQMPLEEKRRYAKVVLDNSGTLEATYAAIEKELQKIL